MLEKCHFLGSQPARYGVPVWELGREANNYLP